VLSVIVPVKDGLPHLHEQLRALLTQECCHQWEVIVSDNGSRDQTAAVVKGYTEEYPRLRLVIASSVRGPGAARNFGVRYARGSILAFCDADDIVHPGWIESWARALTSAELSGGMIDNWTLNGQGAPSPAFRPPPVRNQFGFLDSATSGNMAVRREAFEHVGGFDENIFVGEDIDLCWRLQLAGYRFTLSDAVLSRREPRDTYALFKKSLSYGRCGPALYQRFRDAGLRAEGIAAIRSWAYLVLCIPRLVDPGFRRTWVRLAGWRIGRVVESCRRRVFFP
jgi:glycosyltransferase involved in cell wall biosynthesis